jgi:hypothetical protein
VYATASNQEMLTATMQGLVDRFNLHGERLGDVVGGAVMKHARDFNLVRESVLSTTLSRDTPAFDIQQACGTGLEAAMLVANKIALGHIECGIAGGVDTTSDAPVGLNEKLRKILLDPAVPRPPCQRLSALASRCAPPCWSSRPCHATASRAPACPWASMPNRWRAEWDISPRGPGRTGAQEPPEPGARL